MGKGAIELEYLKVKTTNIQLIISWRTAVGYYLFQGLQKMHIL